MTQTPDIAAPLRNRSIKLWLLLIIAFGICLRMVYFSSEIGGSHTFRQAMVANQIDTLKTRPYPGPKLGFLERYDQVYDYGIVFYDTPIYQYAAARLSDFLGVTNVAAGRLINLAVYAGISLIFYQILIDIGLGVPASMLTILLFAISPLAIQNLIGIYPDTLATLAAYLSFYLLTRYERQGSWWLWVAALLSAFVCTLIKSSIYVVLLGAYAWNLLWAARWRAFRRIDAMAFAVLVAASVGAFVLERTYFNYGQVAGATAGNYDESLRLSWFLGTDSQRFDISQWREILSRFTFEYLFPLLMPFAVFGLWRVIGRFRSNTGEPQRTLLGLVFGACVMILVFFNVFFRHDYYALPLIPIYCALTSIGLLYAYSAWGSPLARRPRTFAVAAAAAIGVCLYYAYSLRLLNYEGMKPTAMTGLDVQELVPNDGYLFYFLGADYTDPTYLYLARRRGVLSNLSNINEDFIGRTIRDHKWNPDNTYLLALGYRSRPELREAMRQRLDKYELKEIGTTYDNGVLYKITPKG
jgi:hypothetical protein